MGGAAPKIFVRPVPGYPSSKWRSTYSAHTRRNPPSREPGVDYYCPPGTELVSIGDGVVTEVGGSIYPATGRYVRVRLDNGMGFRLLHLGPRHSLKGVGQRVRMGEPLAISGASGYGSEFFGASSANDPVMIRNTGGSHTHLTLFPRWNAAFAEAIDPEPFMKDGFLMALSDAQQEELLVAVRNIYAGLYVGGPSTADGGPLMQTIASHGRAIGRIDAAVAPIYREVEGAPTFTSLNQELADVKTLLLTAAGREPGDVTVDIDEAAIVAGIIEGMSDEAVERFALAAADEIDRRARRRLEETPAEPSA